MPSKKTKASKNNYRQEDNRKKCRYRLVMYGQDRKLLGVYYGHMTKPDQGLQSLVRLVDSKADLWSLAFIYENPEGDGKFSVLVRSFSKNEKPVQ